MKKVFFGGSRKLARLNQVIRERTDNVIAKGYCVLVGDANGADRAMQKYLADRGYPNVVVFCMGKVCRNNVGDWETRHIATERSRKDFQYYAAKDAAMSDEADYGFMLWDGESKGTLNNVVNLLERNKKVVVYFGPAKTFVTLRNPYDVGSLLRDCDPVAAPQRFERTLRVSSRLNADHPQLNLA